MKPRYNVYTWDADLGDWSAPGIRPHRNLTLWQVRTALRKLQGRGYSCDYTSRDGGGGDPSVRVEVTRD